jgi:phosphatidylglycerol lysyltransferase
MIRTAKTAAFEQRRRSVPPALWTALALGVFTLSIWLLHHTLQAYRLNDIVLALRSIPGGRMAAAALLTALNYLVLTGYDALGLRYLGAALAYPKIALASFVSYAIANNTGTLSLVAGSGVRYRYYAGWGLPAPAIARVIAFCTLSFWLGFLAIGGVLFLVEPFALPAALHLPFPSSRPLGLLFVAAASAYLLVSARRGPPLRLGSWEFALPGPALAMGQMAISVVDWTLAASILYLLIPAARTLPFAQFFAYYLLAQVAGLASTVPGGIGVFESVMLILVTPAIPASSVFGALLAYRGIYYLLPLAAAGVTLAVRQALAARAALPAAALALGRVLPGLVPDLLATLTFVSGAVLLFSGSLPAESSRFSWLADAVPLAVLEFSHFLGSLAGAGLLLLGWGLQRRLDAAWLLTAVLLAAGSVFSLVKGLDYEEAAVLALMLAALLPFRRRFYRKASLLAEPFSAGWAIAVGGVLLTSTWLVLFAYKHVEFTGSLWWQFALAGHAPRSLRALLGTAVALLIAAAWRLLHPLRYRPAPPLPEDLDRAEAVIRAGARTSGYLALLGDKALLFSRNRDAFLMFAVQGRSWVALGDPIGPEREIADLLWELRGLSDRYGGRTVFYEVGRDYLPLYIELGLTPLKIGEEARVELASFSLEGGAHKGLRHAHHRLAAGGCHFEIVEPPGVPAMLGDLRRVSDAWLLEKKSREKRFSLGWFHEDYLRRLPAAVVRREGAVLAFANLWPGGGKEELSCDLMRHLPEAPPGTMDFLFVEILLWGRAQGYRWFNFGMAPLAGLEDRMLSPLWNKVGSFIYSHGEPFYNFAGLRAYKEKFDPVWESRYLAVPGASSLPRVLPDIATLVAGGARGVLAM